ALAGSAPRARPAAAPAAPSAAVDEPPPMPPPSSRRREEFAPPAPRRPLLEILLDPRSIQWLLASGGALLALGLVIWLATKGLFSDPLTMAVLLGAGNLALLFGGWFVLLRTPFHLAGRALTLLACLLLPFHIWLYDAQGLILVTEGGHLWLPAL